MNMIHANNERINVKPPQLSTEFRTRDVIMNAERLGAMHQTRISCVRWLMKSVMIG